MKSKHIYAIDAVVLVVTLGAVMFLINYTQPLVIAPVDNLTTTQTSILFSIEKANQIFIDDNQEFTSPEEIEVKDNLVINLKPGVYYWKTVGILESEIRKLTIESEVNLMLKKQNSGYSLMNAGNEKLNIAVYNNTQLVDNKILNINEEKNVSGTKFVGSVDGE